MKTPLPATMRAVFQEKEGAELIIKEVEVPDPGEGEVLVKMHYSPINPSDLSQLKGTLAPLPKYPFIPGIEGSGTVVARGKGMISSLRMGKRVACSPKGKGGTWSEYLLTDATKCIPLGRNINDEDGSMLIVNPMTALALIDIALKGGYKTIVNNAAASSLGQMLVKLCRRHKIDLIKIVRNNVEEDILRKIDSENILNSADTDFARKFKKLTQEMGAKLLFDAVGGEQASILIEESPKDSRIILYANLSNTSFTVDSRKILQHGKTVEGFSLPLWTQKKSILQLLKHTAGVKKFISEENKTVIRAKYDISDINKAIDEYKRVMSGGKVLLRL